jgi:sulfite reductase alpha subunit-like flavoprotein
VCVRAGYPIWRKVASPRETRLMIGTEIPVGLVKGGMRVPEDDIPCIFVGPGTGVAPMRAMIEQRIHDKHTDNLLFFGNRNRTKDFLFENEWQQYQEKNELSLLLAFSRDGAPDEKKTYVQDVILRNSASVYDKFVRRRGKLFISGSSGKMPQAVKEAVVEIIVGEEGMSKEVAAAKLAAIGKEGRWVQETW